MIEKAKGALRAARGNSANAGVRLSETRVVGTLRLREKPRKQVVDDLFFRTKKLTIR